MRKIAIVTGSRADYGLLRGIMTRIQADPTLELQVIATNMHLSAEFGLTYREIERDGFRINRRVEMLLSSDTPNATAKSVGLGTIGFADAYEELRPDLLLVLGDRYEILAAVSAALFYQIPVAHLHGGEITEGAYDDSIRHAVTKMSHLHFTATEAYRNRVIQLGESPDRVFWVGAPGVENVASVTPLSQAELEQSIGFTLGQKSLLITFHPVTLEQYTAAGQCENLLAALAALPDYKLLFTLPNSDTDGRIIIRLVEAFVAAHPDRAMAIPSLGLTRYLSALRCVSAVVGNSSSGIIEVPGFGIPTLDIGDRQKGRIAAHSVCHCGVSRQEIEQGLATVLSPEFSHIARQAVNPYAKAGTADAILRVIRDYPLETLRQKSFYNL